MSKKLSTHSEYLLSIKRHKFIIHFLRILIAFLLIAGWEFAAQQKLIDAFIFSSPRRIAICFIQLCKENFIWKHLSITIIETMICFFFVMVLAFLISTLMWRFRNIFEILEPLLILLNSLPKSALAPVLIVWLGNNVKTIIVAAVSVAVFGAILSLYTAFIDIEPEKIRLIQTLGGKKRHEFLMLVVPASLPTIISTMKVNLGLSLVGVIIGEFLAAKKGLGYLIIYGSQVFKMDWVLMSIVILGLLSVLLYFFINLLEKYAKKRWN